MLSKREEEGCQQSKWNSNKKFGSQTFGEFGCDALRVILEKHINVVFVLNAKVETTNLIGQARICNAYIRSISRLSLDDIRMRVPIREHKKALSSFALFLLFKSKEDVVWMESTIKINSINRKNAICLNELRTLNWRLHRSSLCVPLELLFFCSQTKSQK